MSPVKSSLTTKIDFNAGPHKAMAKQIFVDRLFDGKLVLGPSFGFHIFAN